jgi:hypothetical protein
LPKRLKQKWIELKGLHLMAEELAPTKSNSKCRSYFENID